MAHPPQGSTAYGLGTPELFVHVNTASLSGTQQSATAASTAALSRLLWTVRVPRLHPVAEMAAPVVGPALPSADTRRRQAGELPGERLDLVVIEILADQAHGQVPALRTVTGPFDLRHHRRATRPDDPLSLQLVQRRPNRALGQLARCTAQASARWGTARCHSGPRGWPARPASPYAPGCAWPSQM